MYALHECISKSHRHAVEIHSDRIAYRAPDSELYESNPIEVLNHAANHGYSELADKAAAQTMSLSNPLQEALTGLTDPKAAVKWVCSPTKAVLCSIPDLVPLTYSSRRNIMDISSEYRQLPIIFK